MAVFLVGCNYCELQAPQAQASRPYLAQVLMRWPYLRGDNAGVESWVCEGEEAPECACVCAGGEVERKEVLGVSPTQLSLRKLREDGYLAFVVERWNPFARLRQDMWGFDLVACRRDEIVLVQATSATNVSARVRKIGDMESTPRLREAGFRMLVWGWKKVKNRWQVVERDVS